jgi:hypothetical protein
MTLNPFHLAMPVHDLEQARLFYGKILGFEEGRSSEHWVDYNFYGHQFVAHLNPNKSPPKSKNLVDGESVPVPHFGVILDWDDWRALESRLKQQDITFIIEPTIRFKGQTGEQATMFFEDYSGNALEFKSFKNQQDLFSKEGQYA